LFCLKGKVLPGVATELEPLPVGFLSQAEKNMAIKNKNLH